MKLIATDKGYLFHPLVVRLGYLFEKLKTKLRDNLDSSLHSQLISTKVLPHCVNLHLYCNKPFIPYDFLECIKKLKRSLEI